MKNILVTGGSGFIGRGVVSLLRQYKGFHIKVFDLQKPNNPDVEHIYGSVNDVEALDKAMEGCEIAIHLAATLGVSNCQQNIEEVIETNIIGTTNILKCCKKHNVKKLLFTSSSEIYGDSPVDKYSESDLPKPKSPYGMSKVLSENLIESFANKYQVSCSVVRFFNVYGPFQRADFVVQKFIDAALSNEPIYVYGDGNQTRTFTFIEDAARGVSQVLFDLPKSSGFFNIFNIGSNETVTIGELAKYVTRLTGSECNVVYLPYSDQRMDREEKYEIYRRIPNIKKAKNSVGYEPKTTLNNGLSKTIDWFRENVQSQSVSV